MGRGSFITASKTVTVVRARAAGYVRMPVLIAVIDIWSAVVVEVLACSFNAIMETLTLDIAELLGWNIPASGTLSVAWGWWRWAVWLS